MDNLNTVNEFEVAKFSKLAHEWWNPDGALKTLHDINPARLKFIEQFISFSGNRILDLGCGGGILSESMAARGADVTGLDVEVEAIHAARTHASPELPVTYVCQPIEDYESIDLFDAVVCMEMLEHVSDPAAVIQQSTRLLKQGGYLLLSTINRTLTAYMGAVIAAEYILGLLPRQTHDYSKFIKPSELAAMVREAEFEVVGLSGLSYDPFNRTATLQKSVSVNYLLACRKV